MDTLRRILTRIDGKGYGAYRELKGRCFHFPFFDLFADGIQSDPFAPPSRFRIRVSQSIASFPEDTYSTPSREVGTRDFVVRAFGREAVRVSERRGRVCVDTPGQEVIERSTCQINSRYVEMRVFVGLPARGRTVLGRVAQEILCKHIPRLVENTMLFRNIDRSALYTHIQTCEDADFLRSRLGDMGLCGFVADGSILPRRSGVDDRPLEGGIPFRSPDSLRVEVDLPNRGRITGMGIPGGVTLIVGGGFHGKSTLLNALEMGIYNHIPGDGREFVVMDGSAVKIRAEDGRSVVGVDLSPFIGRLPGGVDTGFFVTQNASGSTSQASNILEALEAGSRVLLLDEDTCATNFMIRDRRMQALVEKSKEPITPFVDRVRALYRDFGVSTILVMGGAGDYFDVADTVIAMVDYEPMDVTARAKEIARVYPTGRVDEGGGVFGSVRMRIPMKEGVDTSKGRKDVHLKAKGTKTLIIGREQIDLSFVEQIVEDGQVKAIGYALAIARERFMDGRRTLREVAEEIEGILQREGLDGISLVPFPGDLVRFRKMEFCQALNRLRGIRIKRG